MYGTITMKQLRAGMAARKAAYKLAQTKSEKAAIMDGALRMLRLISVLSAVGLVASASTFV